ncbi:GLPGLI family protein [uncultured Polaribacter sp.]|uniref:GLPGLI family protein n=1 Tax=uncultured Polaribacter sp. TaxID=174711 RepID=UPI0026053F37|nr:GLPGLI family protein [uncultured Polaribacter sp.]
MKTLLTTIAILFAFAIKAQNFTGKAVYKTSQKSTFKFKDGKNAGIDEKMQEELRQRMQKMNQKTFILNFTKNTSTYKQEEKLENPGAKIGATGVKILSLGGSSASDVYFKNSKENRFVNQTEIQGKRFLIKDSLPKHAWQLSSETKNIGQYTCYKATFTKEVKNKKITMVNGESKEEVTKETIVTTAWYTPEIPLNNGPANYQGLPGLILEVNNGKKIIVCTEVVLNSKESISIQEPEKGKIVTQKKFDKIKKQKTEEMLEKMKGRNGLDLGNGLNIKFGG